MRSEIIRRGEEAKGAHRQLVAPGLPGSELPGKIVERVEHPVVVEPLLVFPVAAFHFAVVPGRIGADELQFDSPQSLCRDFESGQSVGLVARKPVGELKAVVCLDAVDFNAALLIVRNQAEQEVPGRVRALFLVGIQVAEPGVLINGGVLDHALACGFTHFTHPGNDLDIDLDAFSREDHLLIRLGFVDLLLRLGL